MCAVVVSLRRACQIALQGVHMSILLCQQFFYCQEHYFLCSAHY